MVSALATSSEYINQFAESKFSETDIHHRFNVQEGADIKLFEYNKMDALADATKRYLKQKNTENLLRACVSKLRSISGPHSGMTGGERRTFSRPDDIHTLAGSLNFPDILKTVQAAEANNNAIDIPPESLWSRDCDHEIILTRELKVTDSTIAPIGFQSLVFSQSPPPVNNDGDNRLIRRHSFPALPVSCSELIKPGRWLAVMLFMMVKGSANKTDSKRKVSRRTEENGNVILRLSTFVKSTAASQKGILAASGACSTEISASVVPLSNEVTCWQILEGSGYFSVEEGDSVEFKLSWDCNGYGIRRPLKFFFGGIR